MRRVPPIAAILLCALVAGGLPRALVAASLEDVAAWEAEGDVDALLVGLADPSFRVQDASREALARLEEPLGELVAESLRGSEEAHAELAKREDERALPPLIAALRNGIFRANAIEALGAIRHPDGAAALIEHLTRRGEVVRHPRNYWILSRLQDPRAIPVFMEGLEAPEDEIRAASAWALYELVKDRPIPRMVELLHDPSPAVRAPAAWFLFRHPADSARPRLVELLRDLDGQVRIAAVWALAATRDPALFETVAALLDDREPGVRVAAAGAVPMLGEVEVTRDLLLRLVLFDPDAEVREEAAKRLEESGDPLGRHLLGALAGEEAAVAALTRSSDPRAIDALARLLSGTDPLLRESAAGLLARLEQPGARQPLFDLAGGWHPGDRWLATQALLGAAESPGETAGILFRIAIRAGTLVYLLLLAAIVAGLVRLARTRRGREAATVQAP